MINSEVFREVNGIIWMDSNGGYIVEKIRDSLQVKLFVFDSLGDRMQRFGYFGFYGKDF